MVNKRQEKLKENRKRAIDERKRKAIQRLQDKHLYTIWKFVVPNAIEERYGSEPSIRYHKIANPFHFAKVVTAIPPTELREAEGITEALLDDVPERWGMVAQFLLERDKMYGLKYLSELFLWQVSDPKASTGGSILGVPSIRPRHDTTVSAKADLNEAHPCTKKEEEEEKEKEQLSPDDIVMLRILHEPLERVCRDFNAPVLAADLSSDSRNRYPTPSPNLPTFPLLPPLPTLPVPPVPSPVLSAPLPTLTRPPNLQQRMGGIMLPPMLPPSTLEPPPSPMSLPPLRDLLDVQSTK